MAKDCLYTSIRNSFNKGAVFHRLRSSGEAAGFGEIGFRELGIWVHPSAGSMMKMPPRMSIVTVFSCLFDNVGAVCDFEVQGLARVAL
jgi:hypothetical protein